MIVLDTDVLIEVERANPKVISALAELRKKHPENLAVTSAVHAEFVYGLLVRKKKVPEEVEAFDVLDFDKESATIFAEQKQRLERQGTPIPLFDLLTASCVMSRGATLASFDKHFEQIQELKLVRLSEKKP